MLRLTSHNPGVDEKINNSIEITFHRPDGPKTILLVPEGEKLLFKPVTSAHLVGVFKSESRSVLIVKNRRAKPGRIRSLKSLTISELAALV